MKKIRIAEAGLHAGQEVVFTGWIFNTRSSGKIHFLQLRDGSGVIQCVADAGTLPAKTLTSIQQLTIESSAHITGTIKKESRSPSGVELQLTDLQVVHRAEEYPIGKKEHGVDFLLDHRHLWVRSQTQVSILRIRDQVIWALRSFFRDQGFVLTDTPILTPTSCEGTTTLFETDYFGTKAFLSQSGQLYLEALASALGKVYDFGPVFRAEKSKTKRHLTEFWMLDAEMAFADHEDNIRAQIDCLQAVTRYVLKHCTQELATLKRNSKKLEQLLEDPVRLTYAEAVAELQKLGSDITNGSDFGNDDETMLMQKYNVPVIVTNYPKEIKAFYMKEDPNMPGTALCNDLLLPEGYGEVFGGSQRIDDKKTLITRLKEHKLSEKDFSWYVDLRSFGSVPHAGFGVGLERLVTFFTGRPHVRESIPFPRTLNRLIP